jgi:tripeptidyl-peptidase-1
MLASFTDLNNKLIAAGSVGVSVIAASGDRGSFGFEYKQCRDFMTAVFPGSSPFVTSVGATTLVAEEASQCPREGVASANAGGAITSGGGFSGLFAAESYQADTVKAYLKSKECALPDKKSFESSMRAYPDIALMGNLFPVALGDKDKDWYSVDGTSASAPVFAAFIALIHDARQKKGISPNRIGFLNLYLYEAFNLDSSNFNDVVSGSTSCVSRATCCDLGFEACPGFDAASGLGSPDWRTLGKIFYDGEDLPLGSPDPKVVGCGSDTWLFRSYWFWGVVGLMLVGCVAAVIYMKARPAEERVSEYLLDAEAELFGGEGDYRPPEGRLVYSNNNSIN